MAALHQSHEAAIHVADLNSNVCKEVDKHRSFSMRVNLRFRCHNVRCLLDSRLCDCGDRLFVDTTPVPKRRGNKTNRHDEGQQLTRHRRAQHVLDCRSMTIERIEVSQRGSLRPCSDEHFR